MCQSHSLLFIVLCLFDFFLEYFNFNWKRRRKTFAYNPRHLVATLCQSSEYLYQMNPRIVKYHRIQLKSPRLVWAVTEERYIAQMYDNRMLASYWFKCSYWNGQKVSYSSRMQFGIINSEHVRMIEFVSSPLLVATRRKNVCC